MSKRKARFTIIIEVFNDGKHCKYNFVQCGKTHHDIIKELLYNILFGSLWNLSYEF